ncbi:MAG: hypothetical protein VKO65_08415 [Cyanobacteriota bacterium]|nr:hypothetical protein [Cyanobacteriota bacterium]
MPVASPYAVFRAADLAWAPPPCQAPELMPPRRMPSPSKRHRRHAASGVIQGELFSPLFLPTHQC